MVAAVRLANSLNSKQSIRKKQHALRAALVLAYSALIKYILVKDYLTIKKATQLSGFFISTGI